MGVGCINDVVLLAMVGMKDAGAVDVAAVVAGWCDAIVGDHIHKISMVMIANGADWASNDTVCKMFAGRIFMPDEPALRIVVPFCHRLLAGYSCPMSLTVDSGTVSSSTSSASLCAFSTLRERRATSTKNTTPIEGVAYQTGLCNRYSLWHPDPTRCHFNRSRAPGNPGQVSAVLKHYPATTSASLHLLVI